MLCDVCLGVLQSYRYFLFKENPVTGTAEDDEISRGHHGTLQSLLKSTGNCYVCESVWNRLSDWEQASLRSHEPHATSSKRVQVDEHDYVNTSRKDFITFAYIGPYAFDDQTYRLVISFDGASYPVLAHRRGLFLIEKITGITLPVAASFQI